jgi:hypothetical protein
MNRSIRRGRGLVGGEGGSEENKFRGETENKEAWLGLHSCAVVSAQRTDVRGKRAS